VQPVTACAFYFCPPPKKAFLAILRRFYFIPEHLPAHGIKRLRQALFCRLC
jgi:hypothetical protein